MSILDSNNFGEKIYNRFPSKYRADDVHTGYALKRFIFATADGGFKHIIDDTNGLFNLIRPDTSRPDVLKILYEQYGMEVFNGIPEEYLRRFLPFLADANSYRGSLTAIDFISTSVTGIPTTTEIEANDEDNSVDVTVTLELTSSVLKYFPDYNQLTRILENFIPFYCTLYVVYNYSYKDDDAFHLFVGHAIKFINTLYPTDIEVDEDPTSDLDYYCDEDDLLLVIENNDLIIDG